MTIFKNFKSQHFMYYDRNIALKAVYIKIKMLGCFGLRYSARASKTETTTK